MYATINWTFFRKQAQGQRLACAIKAAGYDWHASPVGFQLVWLPAKFSRQDGTLCVQRLGLICTVIISCACLCLSRDRGFCMQAFGLLCTVLKWDKQLPALQHCSQTPTARITIWPCTSSHSKMGAGNREEIAQGLGPPCAPGDPGTSGANSSRHHHDCRLHRYARLSVIECNFALK